MSLAPLKIGPYELSSPFVLAPMAGVTDAPFRRICRRFGAGMTTSEMTTADTSLWQTPKSRYRLDLDLDAEPVAVQIAGSEPAQLAAIEQIETQRQRLSEQWQQRLERARYEADLFALSFTTADCKEGISAFLEKRQPTFRGR